MSLTIVEIVNWKGHEGFQFGTAEEAREFVQKFLAEGGKFWVLDKETKKLLGNVLGITEETKVVLIPVAPGG